MPTISMFYGIFVLEIRNTPLIVKRKTRLEIEKMIVGTHPVEINLRDPEKLTVCLGGKV